MRHVSTHLVSSGPFEGSALQFPVQCNLLAVYNKENRKGKEVPCKYYV